MDTRLNMQHFLLARIAEDEAAAGNVQESPERDRALAECVAKHAIIDLAAAASEDREQLISEVCVGMDEMSEGVSTDPGMLTLCALAEIYSAHPDHEKVWASS